MGGAMHIFRSDLPRVIAAIVALMVAMACPGLAEAQSEQTDPDWVSPIAPRSDGQVDYSPLLMLLGIDAKGIAVCRIWREGPPEDCAVNTSPAGIGFEQAALRALSRSVLRPGTQNGEVIGGLQVRIPLNLQVSRESVTFPPYEGPMPGEEEMALARQVAALIEPRNDDEYLVDVSADHRDEVLELIQQVEQNHRPHMVETFALAIARTRTREELILLAMSDEDAILDQLTEWGPAWAEHYRAQEAFSAELRRLVCDRFDCEVQTPAPPVLSETHGRDDH